MKIKAITVKDFKGLKEIELSPDPALVIVTGRNEQGKTSLIDAIEGVLCGSKSAPARPVRKGCDRAEVVADLGDLVVTRRWDQDGSDRLTLTNPDGSKPARPQTLLDRLFARVAFDPSRFSRQEPKEQVKVLRRLAGLDDEFARIDAGVKEAEEERTRVNRDAKRDEAVLSQTPESEFDGVPEDEVSVSGLMEDYEAAVREQATNDQIRGEVERCNRAIARCEHDRYEAAARVAELRRQLANAEESLAKRSTAVLDAVADRDETAGIAGHLTDPDLVTLQAELRQVEAVNARVRERDRWAVLRDRWVTNREAALELTGTIESLRAEKDARVKEARYPVPGLDVRDDGVLWNGVPVEQVSAARKIRLGLAVAAALSPELKVALVRDGSLLDDEALAELRAWCEETGYQVWLEKVGGTASPEGVVIEDGRVLADRQPGRHAPDRTPNPGPAPVDEAKVRQTLDALSRPRGTTFEETKRDADRLF